MGKVFVCGDIHGAYDIKKIKKSWVEQKELSKEDVLVQLGDFGWIWYPIGTNKEQEYWLNWLANRNYTLLVVLGNHENYDEISTLPETEMFGGTVQYYHSKGRFGEGYIYFAKRGQVYTINGKKYFTFGGAQSQDKIHRVEGRDWWAGELPTYSEFEEGMKSLDSHAWEVDYVLSHTCPSTVMGDFIHITISTYGRTKDPVAEYFTEIYKNLKFKEWHFGHLHVDSKQDYSATGDGIFYCHYNKAPHEILI